MKFYVYYFFILHYFLFVFQLQVGKVKVVFHFYFKFTKKKRGFDQASNPINPTKYNISRFENINFQLSTVDFLMKILLRCYL